MIHATEVTLDILEPLLARIRKQRTLQEKKRGVFYCKTHAFLHFHEEGPSIFADIKMNGQWCRFPVNKEDEKEILIDAIARTVVQ